MSTDVGSVDILEQTIWLYKFPDIDPINIYNLVTGIDIYESLDEHCMQCDIYVNDGIDLLDYFPVGGEEVVEFAIQSEGRKECAYKFFVERVEGIAPNPMGNAQSYKLKCVTLDFLYNSSIVFSKRYKEMEFSDAVLQCIQVDLRSEKPVYVEKTKGFFDHAVNRVRPFQVIDLLTERAVSAEFASSFFIFYEDNEQYNFTTIENLIKEREDYADDFYYFYDTSNQGGDFEKVVNAFNILDFQRLDGLSSVDRVLSGGIRNQVRAFNIYHGDYFETHDYTNIHDGFSFNAHSDSIGDQNSQNFNESVHEYPAISSMIVFDELRPASDHIKTIPFKRAFRSKMLSTGVKIRVYGDTEIMIGDSVGINIPQFAGVTSGGEDAELINGRFIVKDIKHMIRNGEDGQMSHEMILDCRKIGLNKGLE